MERILTSELFKLSPQHKKLLHAIVTESVAGRTDRLKEVSLANDVLENPRYDPQEHSSVRVRVKTIRRKLEQYFQRPSAKDRVLIEIPQGRYIATFSYLPVQEPHRTPMSRQYWLAVAVLSSAAICAAVVASVTARPDSLSIGVPEQITFDTGSSSQPAISRDGSTLVYASDRASSGYSKLWVKELNKEPRQLTSDTSLDMTPDISSDGKTVVFRSSRKMPGIWSMPLKGGAAKLIAAGGFSPRFSPDSKWISFVGVEDHVFITGLDGRQKRRVDVDVNEVACPIWSPNGQSVLFTARSEKDGTYDFWLASVDPARTQSARPLGLNAKLNALRLPAISSSGDCPQDWFGDRLLFVTQANETPFLFQVPIRSGKVAGPVEAFPAVVGADKVRVVQSQQRRTSLVFAMERRQTNIWGSNFSGSMPLRQWTNDITLIPGFTGTWPSLSGDGNTLAFITDRSRLTQICIKDLRSGAERILDGTAELHSPVLLDSTGNRIVFTRQQNSLSQIVIRDVSEGTERLLPPTACPVLHDWSRDGEELLCSDSNVLFQLHIRRSEADPIVTLTRSPLVARFSPDRRWVSFALAKESGGEYGGYIVPVQKAAPSREICQGTWGLSLHWAPDGNALFYWSIRDGFRCLYRQPLDGLTKAPRGDAVAVLHRHLNQHYPSGGGTLALASDRFAMTLKDTLANIWTADLSR